MISEQLIGLAYTVCVLDFEGDHAALGGPHRALTVGGGRSLPAPHDIAAILTRGETSVIVDLSLINTERRAPYAIDLLNCLFRTRHATGTPQWLVVDEAHVPLHDNVNSWWSTIERESGLCIVTYREDQLAPAVSRCADYIVRLEPGGTGSIARCHAAPRHFTCATRVLTHVRHRHKYTAGYLPRWEHFHFRDSRGATGWTAGNIPEFARMIRRAGKDVLLHHAAGRDFSRWLRYLSHNRSLADSARALERQAMEDEVDVDALRTGLLTLLSSYFGASVGD
jgi:hypothetical protein